MSSLKNRPVQKDVAKAAGVDRSTVSLVFSNRPGISEETRKRVLKAARDLRYAPDPFLSSLAAYRSRKRYPTYKGVLAWVVNNLDGFNWKEVPTYREYFLGAARRAKYHGFQLEVFDLQSPGMSEKKLMSIFNARNIRGLLLAPQPRANMTLNFPFEKFSVVAFGYTLVKPRFHTITSAQYLNTQRAIREARKMGYRRVGFVFSEMHNIRVNYHYLSAFLLEDYLNFGKVQIPPYTGELQDLDKLNQWYEQYRPDVLVTGSLDLTDIFKESHCRIPPDISVVCVLIKEKNGKMSGIYENSYRIGSVAVDQVVAMIHRGEVGIPTHPQHFYVEGSWNPGNTLRSESSSQKAASLEEGGAQPLP